MTPDDTEDHQRLFEERALKNVRELVDRLEREGPDLVSDGATLVLCTVILAAIVAAGGALELSSRHERGRVTASACVDQALAARTAEAESHLRESRPDLSPRTIARLASEDPRVSAKATADCDDRSTWR